MRSLIVDIVSGPTDNNSLNKTHLHILMAIKSLAVKSYQRPFRESYKDKVLNCDLRKSKPRVFFIICIEMKSF